MSAVAETPPLRGPRLWLAAIRPATLTAALAPVLVGAALSASEGAVRPLVLAATALAAALIQVGTNLYNDYGDFRRGADTNERLGPVRVTQRGLIAPERVRAAAYASLAGALALGVYLVFAGGWPILAVGVASLLCAVAYTGGPFPLAYVGLGDVFVLAFFGVAAVAGPYYLQTDAVSAASLWAGLAVGATATAILVVNNLRDRHTDAAAGKRTLIVRFGARFGRAEYIALLAASVLLPVIAASLGHGPRGWLLAAASLPLVAKRVAALLRLEGRALNPELGATARLGLIQAVLLAIGAFL